MSWSRIVPGARAASLLVAAALAVACSANHSSNVNVVPGQLVTPASSVYILAVPDGVSRSEGPAEGSGFAMAVGLRDTLLAHGFSPLISDIGDIDVGIKEAAGLGYKYLLRSRLTQWEDNATPISTRPDRAALSVEVYDVKTHALVATSTHAVAGAHGDYLSRSPDRFVPELADSCLGAIFGWSPTVFIRK
jgi:hypothetical protein